MSRYKMKFKKVCIPGNKVYEHREISDAYLLSILLELQHKYYFDIISTRFNRSASTSYIKIKCDKSDKGKIFSDYCARLDGYIDSVSF